MEVARKHHYVTAAYLAQFTNTGKKKGQLCALDFSTGKFFPPRPEDVAYRIDYNRIEVNGLRPDAYERAQGKFEGQAVRHIREICKTGKLPAEEAISYIYNLLLLFAVKNPAIRHAMAKMQDKVYRRAMKLWTSGPAVYEQQVENAKRAGFIKPDITVSYEKARDFVQRNAYAIKIHSQSHVLTEISAFNELLPAVAQRYWSVMIVKPGTPDLITCDRPSPPQLGIDKIVFTISPRHALLGTAEPYAPEEFEIDFREVAQINTDLLEQANHQIYSRTNEVILVRNGQIGIYDMRKMFPGR